MCASATQGGHKKPRKGADGHRRPHARLVAAYLQSQSQGCSLGHFRNFRRSVTLTLTLDRPRSHWYAYPVDFYPHTKLDRNRKNYCGRTNGWTHLSYNLLSHRLTMT